MKQMRLTNEERRLLQEIEESYAPFPLAAVLRASLSNVIRSDIVERFEFIDGLDAGSADTATSG